MLLWVEARFVGCSTALDTHQPLLRSFDNHHFYHLRKDANVGKKSDF